MIDVARITPEAIRPLKRTEYERLVELGVFGDERIELIRGVLVTMSPQGSRHAQIVARLTRLLVPALLEETVEVRVQSPLALLDDSEPEPDLAIVPVGDYWDGHPMSAHLIIEVADSSLRKDRSIKAELYAAAGVPEYWLINLVEETIEVHTGPSGEGYRHVARYRRDEPVRPAAFGHIEVRLTDLM